MSEKGKLWLQLCVMDGQVRKRIINLETAEGMDKNLEAFGFTREGMPCFTADDPNAYYKLSGGYRSGVNLNNVFNPTKRGTTQSGGMRLYERKDGKLVEKCHLYGYEALATFLSMKGCKIAEETLKKEVDRLIRDKAAKIFCYRLDQLNGLQSFHEKTDCWMFDPSIPDSDAIQYEWVNELLKKLGSPWRIVTDASLQALRKSEFKKLID